MKLLMCMECGDIFSLNRTKKGCGCGASGGLYVDNLNAHIWGPSQPIGFSNQSFRKSYQMQLIENVYQQGSTCCKGVDFVAFFIPEVAESIKRIENP